MIKMNAELQKRYILGGFCVLLFIHLIFVFCSFYGDDDINYARYAAEVVHKGISFTAATDHFQLRWTPIYFTAIFYKIGGINTFTTTLYCFISILLCGIILKKMIRTYGTIEYFLSLLLFFFAHSILFYMHRLLADPTMCLAVLWMYSSYRSFCINRGSHIKYALQFSLALFLAIITKETIIIVLPLFAILFMYDAVKKFRLQFWIYAIIFSSILIGCYLLYFKITTGTYFFRYFLLQSKSYFSECSFDKLPMLYTIKRIGYLLWQSMLVNGDLLILFPAIAAFIYRKKLASSNDKIFTLDLYAFVILICCANFMTISFTNYIPLCHAPRHSLFLFPLAAILSGPFLIAYNKDPRKFILFPILYIVATIIMFFLHAGATKYLYLLLAFVFAARYLFAFINSTNIGYKIGIGLTVFLFSSNYFVDFFKPSFSGYWDLKKLIERNFKGKYIEAKLFSADSFSGELAEFFLEFNNKNVQILPMDSIKPMNAGKLYYLDVDEFSNNSKAKIDSLLKAPNSNFILIDKEKKVRLYTLEDANLKMLK